MDNTIRAVFGGSRFAKTIPITRQDFGVRLLFENVDVPDIFEVHFSDTKHNTGKAKTSIGSKANGVLIPDEYLITGKTVYAWVFVQEDESGMTKYMVEIPVASKPNVSGEQPTPVQRDAWDEAILELRQAVKDAQDASSHYPIVQDGHWMVWDIDEQEYVDSGIKAEGEDGFSPTIDVSNIDGGHRVTISDASGQRTFDVLDGGGGVFIAEYGTTTLEELDEAYEDEKTIIVHEYVPFGLDIWYRLSRRIQSFQSGGANEYLFAASSVYHDNELVVCECTESGWTQRIVSLTSFDEFRHNAVMQYQGEANKGKYLFVGDDGYVTLTSNSGDSGEDEEAESLLVEDEEGNTWHFLAGAGDEGDIVIEDDEGNLWHLPAGQGDDGDIELEDGDGHTWHIVSGSGSSSGEEESGGSLPSGGTAGDILTKTASGAAWVTPASNLDGDNTRPITAAAVNTIVGNIDALLATI